MSSGFSGPLLYNSPRNPAHPFHGLDLHLIERAVLKTHMGLVIGNGEPWRGPAVAGTDGSWVLTDVGTGSSTLALNNAGQLVLTGGTTDEDNSGLQFVGLPLRYSATRDVTCFGRIKLSTAATTDAFFGLAAVDTSLISASAIAVDDALGFFKAATATDYTFHSRKNTTSTTQAMGLTLTNDAYAVVGFTVRAGAIRAYAALDPNDSILTNPSLLGDGISIASTNAPDDIDVLFTLMVGQEGGTTARVLTVDWAFVISDID